MVHVKLIQSTRALLLILIVVAIGVRGGSLFGIDLSFEQKDTIQVAKFTDVDVKNLFPNFTKIDEIQQSVYSVYDGEKLIGTLLNSSPKGDSIVGYVNSTPLLVALDLNNTIVGIRLLPNRESPDFIAKIVDHGMLERWNGTPVSAFSSLNVDGVSGATYSSQAIIKNVQIAVNAYASSNVPQHEKLNVLNVIKWSCAVMMLVASLFLFFMPARLKKFRNYILLFNLLVLGFWVGDTLSINSIYNWIIGGVQLSTRWFIVLVLVVSILIPLFTKKAFYCTCLCPYGAAQELTHKLNRRFKWELPLRIRRKLPLLRECIFGVLVFLLCLGVVFDLTNIEPFSVFMFQSAAVPVIILALSFIVLSFFIPKPWCRYFCPTGQFLEIIRKLFTVK